MRLLFLAAAAAAASIPAVSFADSASCRPRVVQSATTFPTRSATRSIVSSWLFDVSSCDSANPPAQHLIAVQFQNNEY